MLARNYFATVVLAIASLWLASVVDAESGPIIIHALLIRASNEPAAQDARLEKVEYKLRRIFGFEYYRYMGESSTVLADGADGVLSFGGGHRLHVGLRGGGDSIRAEVRWYRGDDLVLNTTVRLQRQVPVILGGISDGPGTLIITFTAQ